MKFFFKLTITLVALGVIVWQLGDIRGVAGLIVSINPIYVLLILVALVADRALMTFKWARLLQGQGLHLPLFRGMTIYCASMVWGIFLPSTVGADAIRAVSTSKMGLDSNKVVASILIERAIGFLSALLLGLLGFAILYEFSALDGRFDYLWWFGGAFLVGGTVAFSATFSQRAFEFIYSQVLHRFAGTQIMNRLRQFHTAYLSYRDKKKSMFVFFVLTFTEQLMPILHNWLIARGLGIDIGLLFVAGAIPLTILISRLPVSIDGLGVYEAIFAFFMSLVGVTVPQAVAIAFAGRILQTATWLPWWMAHTLARRSMEALKEERKC